MAREAPGLANVEFDGGCGLSLLIRRNDSFDVGARSAGTLYRKWFIVLMTLGAFAFWACLDDNIIVNLFEFTPHLDLSFLRIWYCEASSNDLRLSIVGFDDKDHLSSPSNLANAQRILRSIPHARHPNFTSSDDSKIRALAMTSNSSRDSSRDRTDSLMLKHQHSFSDSGRASVPMYVADVMHLKVRDRSQSTSHFIGGIVVILNERRLRYH